MRRRCGTLLLMVGLAAAPAWPASAAAILVPPITDPATGEHHPGKPVFAELVTPSLAQVEPFYASLLGWSFRSVPGGRSHYAEAYLNGNPVAGLVEQALPAGARRRSAWLSFFATTDVDAAERVALQEGARLLVRPHDLAARGREAILADPQGAVFAMLASSSGDPPDLLSAPGDWIWRSLITTDPEAAGAFYQKVFGYQLSSLPQASSGPTSPGPTSPGLASPGPHLLLASETYARASVNPMPAGRAGAHPDWIAYVRVDNAAAAAAKVAALGGRVLVEPRIDRQGGMIAIIADPLGAPLGLLEWSETAGGTEGTR